MRGRRALVVGVAVLAGALTAGPAETGVQRTAAPPAAGGSILYLKAGKLWVASPDGRIVRRVPHTGSFDNPSQADDGTIVAQRGIQLYRLNRQGKALNAPITTAFRTNSILPSFKGPFWPEVSPDGTKIAYTYSFTAETYDYSCSCVRVVPSLNTAYTYSNRFTDAPEKVFGNARFYSRSSWIDNRRVLMTTEALFDFAGNVLDQVAVDTLGGGGESYARWFSECVGCESLQTLELYPLGEGEMTRQRDKLVFVSGALGTKEPGARMLIYALKAAPPAIPSSFCEVTEPNGTFTSPTWSPDGRSLAWQDAKGIWVGRVGNLAGKTCELTRKLVLPGGSQPDWGPARA